ncbi:PIN domain-containing protein [Caldilinea sp.]|uniref:PIN domain-containing protein n=1 Tax=Caldilinea sp. TaxID=2293560 RepID=UPI002D02AAA6|nr:PIN domain-containing protein [Caldilinea sp.]
MFVSLLENYPVFADLATAVLTPIEQGAAAGVTSTLTLTELLTGPVQAANLTALRDYELHLTNFPHLTLHACDADVARQVALVRAATGLRTPDAIRIATVALAGATLIVGNDKAWQGKTGSLALLLLNEFV